MAYLLSTATKAVRVAQRCSLGNARAFSSANAGPSLGAIDLNVRSMKPSATLAINEASLALQAEGKTVAKFGLGQSPFPVPDVMVEALQAHAAEKDYLAVAGLAPFRQVLADWCNRTVGGRDHRADDIVVGPGSKELLFLLQLVYSAELLLPEASWVSYQPQAKLLRRPVKWVPCTMDSGWHVTPEALEAVCKDDADRPRILVLNSPSNPTGAVLKDDALQALAAVCRKYKVLVISDEIYGKLTYDGNYYSIARYYPEGTVVMSGASKWLGSGGWRVGFAAFPENLSAVRDAMLTCASETFTSVAAPLQYACMEGFKPSAEIDAYLDASVRCLRFLNPAVTGTLREAGVKVHDADGGFYIMPDFSECRRAQGYSTSPELALDAITNAQVAMLPGMNFGLKPERLITRMAFVDFDGAAAIKAIADVPADVAIDSAEARAFVDQHCPVVMDGARRLRDLMAMAPEA